MKSKSTLQEGNLNRTSLTMGIPIDQVEYESVVERIMQMVDMYSSDYKPRYVATVNVDFLVNALPGFSEHPHRDELLTTLRRADMVTADGAPIVWLNRLMGYALSGRVTGADLVPLVANACGKQGKSLFILGGDELEDSVLHFRPQQEQPREDGFSA